MLDEVDFGVPTLVDADEDVIDWMQFYDDAYDASNKWLVNSFACL